MARSRTVDAPATSDVYFGMVLCSFLSILAAVGLLAWELTNSYGWETTPAALAAPNLPKVPAMATAKAEGSAQAPVEEKPVAALTPNETPAPVSAIVEPVPIPAILTVKPNPPTPAPATPAPVPASTGPTPGFELPRR